MPSIAVRNARPEERPHALRLALAEPDCDARQAQRTCQMTESFLRTCGGQVGAVHVAEAGGRLLAACAALDLPGRVSLLMLPAWTLARADPAALVDMLCLAGQAARDRGLRFAQVMVEPQTAEQVRPHLARAGFEHLADLQYMHRDAYDPSPVRPVDGVTWSTLPEITEDDFADVVRHTYVASRDCPGLTGVRTMQDVMASHRSAGPFDPAGWYVLAHHGRRAGVLITARTAFRPNLEVVYVGLVPQARGQGLGRTCMQRAIQRARDLSLSQVTLAVDAANASACRLYQGMGFAVHGRKAVWIQVYRRADAEGLFSLPGG